MSVPGYLHQVSVDRGPPSTAEIDEKPWKYLGYRAFSSFLVRDADNFLVRRFDKLFGRGILYMQDQLSEREEKLEFLDQKYMNVEREEDEINNGTIRDDMRNRKELVHEIYQLQKQYFEMIIMFSQLGARKRAKQSSVDNLRKWVFGNHSGIIMDEEAQFIHEKDLISVIELEKSPIRAFFESHIIFRFKVIRRLFANQEIEHLCETDRLTCKGAREDYLDNFASIVVLMAGIALFIAPLWILQALDEFSLKLWVITIFIVALMAILKCSTSGRAFEVLATTAGYAAVLVVFLQFGIDQTRH